MPLWITIDNSESRQVWVNTAQIVSIDEHNGTLIVITADGQRFVGDGVTASELIDRIETYDKPARSIQSGGVPVQNDQRPESAILRQAMSTIRKSKGLHT